MALSSTRWSILHAAQAGDGEAIGSLCTKYRPAVVAYLKRRGAGEDAEDLAQEVLVGLVDYLPKAHAQAGRFRSLVFAVARNVLSHELERRGAQKRGGGETPLSHPDLDQIAREEPDEGFDREWLANLVRRCLERLRAEHANYFQALQASLLEGQPQAEVAQALGIPTNSVKKHVYRGKQKVGAYLREEVYAYSLSTREAEAELSYLTRLLGPLGAAEAP